VFFYAVYRDNGQNFERISIEEAEISLADGENAVTYVQYFITIFYKIIFF